MGCFTWPSPEHYKKTKRSHCRTQGKKHQHKHRAKYKKKTISQNKPRAGQYKQQTELPKPQWQDTPRLETSLASILAMVNFGSSTPSPPMGKQPRDAPETCRPFNDPAAGPPGWAFLPVRPAPVYRDSEYPTLKLSETFPWARPAHPGRPDQAASNPRESSSSGSDPKTPKRPSSPTVLGIPAGADLDNMASVPPTNHPGGGRGGRGDRSTVFVYPRSMAHAHFVVMDYTKPHAPPVLRSALVPTAAQVSDLVAALAPARAGVELWARTDTGCRALSDARTRAGGEGGGSVASLRTLHSEACQLEVWPAVAPRTAETAEKKRREKKDNTTTKTTTTDAGERVRRLEQELEEAKKKEREETTTKKKEAERDEAKKKAVARRPARRPSLAYPTVAPGSGEESGEAGRRPARPPPGKNLWLSDNDSPKTPGW